jgi:hypothetical protein
MIIETSRIVFGVAMLCFHKPIAEFMHVREQELTAYLVQRGFQMPTFPSVSVTRDVYFCLGVVAVILSVAQLWIPA